MAGYGQIYVAVATILLALTARPPTSAAQAVKGEVTFVIENGFGRLLFKLTADVESQVHLANNILIVSFRQPVDLNVDKLSASAPEIISMARRDPDGRGVRIALSHKVTLNAMAVAERLFVDLLPESWSGPPPGLPRDVIEELARRAREAEKKLKQQLAAPEGVKIAPIRVRVATQPTFTRYSFDLPRPISVVANNGKDRLTLVFDALIKFDLADAKATLPPAIGSIDTDVDPESVSVRFTFTDTVDVRTFREGLSYVVDVTPMMPKSAHLGRALRSDQLLAQAAQSPPGKASPSARAEPPRPPAVRTENPADQPPTPASPPAVPATAAREAPAPPGKPTEPNRVREISPQAPRNENATAQPPDRPLAPATTAPVMREVATTPAGKPGDAQLQPSQASAAATPPSSPPSPVAPSERPAQAQAQAEHPKAPMPAAPPPSTGGAVNVTLKRQGDNLTLTFPFATATPGAVFMRAETLWLVFDTDSAIGLSALEDDSSHTIKGVTLLQLGDVMAVRVKLERPRLVSAVTDGPAWVVTVGAEVVEPTRPLGISRNVISRVRSSITIPFDDPRQLHRIEDPDVGDTLLVVTALGPARGFVKPQNFVEVRALASIHGVVLQPHADDLNAELAADKIVVTRPQGLTLSAALNGGPRSASIVYQPHVLDAQAWNFDRQANFVERSDHLIHAAADAKDGKRLIARADLARFYLAHDMASEAKAVLDIALADNPPTAEDSTPIVLRAVAQIMSGRPEQGLKDLANPFVGNQHDAPLWRALAHARQGKWSDAREGFRSAGTAVGTLPIELQRTVLKDMMRAAIEVGDITGAINQMHEIETVGIPRELEPTVSVLTGRLEEGLGHIDDALRAYQTAADSWDRPAAAQGRLRDVVLKRSIGALARPDAIAELESLTTVWRGDETEVEALQLLARLYTEEGRYRDAFHIMRTATAAHPTSEVTRRIHDDAVETFDGLFLGGKADALPAVDALGLFYDFRELTPIGRRGDEMIRRLADRLVAIDLLDQAAELLQHQVDHRLQGAARASIATRLAVIYLSNRKPDRALATLRATRSSELAGELRNHRLLLEARALSELGRHDLAIEVSANIEDREGIKLRSDVLWAAQRWREAAEQIELMYGERWKDFEPLTVAERIDVLRAGIGFALGEDAIGLMRFREKYAGKMGEGPDRRAFDVVTAPIGTTGAEFREIARAVSMKDTLDSFLRDLRVRYPDRTEPRSGEPSPPAPSPQPG